MSIDLLLYLLRAQLSLLNQHRSQVEGWTQDDTQQLYATAQIPVLDEQIRGLNDLISQFEREGLNPSK